MMKNLITYISIGIVVFSTTAFVGYKNDPKTKPMAFFADNKETIMSDTLLDEPLIKFWVQPNYKRGTTLEAIKNADKLDHLIPNYPSNWIEDYQSVEIALTNQDIAKSANGSNNELTPEQKALLNSAQLYSELTIKVTYNMVNTVTQKPEQRQMEVLLRVIPESEAEFKGGIDALDMYLEQKIKQDLPEDYDISNAGSIISFTIDKNGKAHHISILEPSERTEVDDLLVRTLQDMPEWIPAKTQNNQAIEQEFHLYFGLDGC